MRSAVVLVSILVASAPAVRGTQRSSPEAPVIRVLLLGTQGGPRFSADRIGIGTLVQAGPEQLLFDAGRGVTTGMAKASIDPASVARVFLTHLHSDHVISLPELLISPWVQGRLVPLRVWGPEGTRAMMQHFERPWRSTFTQGETCTSNSLPRECGSSPQTFAKESSTSRTA